MRVVKLALGLLVASLYVWFEAVRHVPEVKRRKAKRARLAVPASGRAGFARTSVCDPEPKPAELSDPPPRRALTKP
jgi:hypothetical protein